MQFHVHADSPPDLASVQANFERFAALYPETTLLVDTYDTLEGVRKVIDLQRRLGARAWDLPWWWGW